jgi:hypothetical protein
MHVCRLARAGFTALALLLAVLVFCQTPALARTTAQVAGPAFPTFQGRNANEVVRVPCTANNQDQLRLGQLNQATGNFEPTLCFAGSGGLDVKLTGIRVICSGPYSGSISSSDTASYNTQSEVMTNFAAGRCFSMDTPVLITHIQLKPTIAQVACGYVLNEALLRRVGKNRPVCFTGDGSLNVSVTGVSGVCGGPASGAVFFRVGKKGGWIRFSAGKCLTFTNPLSIAAIFIQR